MRYTEEMDKYIREISPGRLNQEIADMFNERFGTNVTRIMIKSYKSNYGITSGRSNLDYSKKTYYNQLLNKEQIEYLKEIYVGISNRECTRLMNEKFGLSLTCRQIKGQKRRFKLNSGLDGRFVKGQKPNDHCFKKGERNSIETEFKKGHKPHNWVPIGTEMVKSDGYLWVKVKDERNPENMRVNWKQKHKLIWEEAHGPVPKGHCLIFLDGDRTNVCLENLSLLSKSERLIMNRRKLIYDDPELTKTGINVAKLIDAVNKKDK